MPRESPQVYVTMLDYEKTAREYCASLPLEHFMEGTSQAFQRSIFLMAFEQIHSLRPDIQPFNELLIQYDHGQPPIRRQVVPDNMVVLYPERIKAKGSYDVPLQPVKPFFVLEYVSPNNERKDFTESQEKYEKELKIPYYLIFYADNQELTLFKHNRRRYVSITPDERGRYAIPELEVELALVEEWVRFWFRGKLLEMPSVIQAKLEKTEEQLAATLADRDEERAKRQRAEDELARVLAELERVRSQSSP